MGFDLYWAKQPEGAGAANSAADGPEHFRLSESEMVKTLTVMTLLKMLDTDLMRALREAPADFGPDETPPLYETNGNLIVYEPGTPEERWSRALRAAAERKTGLMPSYKFVRNDGWLVTPTEIERSLARYDEIFPDRNHQPRSLPAPVAVNADGTPEIEEVDWWGDFIDWLRQAAEHGGFRVL